MKLKINSKPQENFAETALKLLILDIEAFEDSIDESQIEYSGIVSQKTLDAIHKAIGNRSVQA